MIAPHVDDLWCDFCQEQPYTSISADGAKACTACQLKVLEGIAEAAGVAAPRLNRAQRRMLARQTRLHNDGTPRA